VEIPFALRWEPPQSFDPREKWNRVNPSDLVAAALAAIFADTLHISPSASAYRSIQASAASTCGPELLQEIQIVRSLEVIAGQHHKERICVHASEIASERQFSEGGHFSTADLMNNSPRFGILGYVLCYRLSLYQIGQHPLGYPGAIPRHSIAVIIRPTQTRC
jgi:hypothetical protein